MEVDATDPDYELVWPKEIFKAEAASLLKSRGNPAEQFTYLLEEAFAGSTPASDFRQQASLGWGASPDVATKERELIIKFLRQVDRLRTPGQRPPYWHQHDLTSDRDSEKQHLQQGWAKIVRALESRGYFYRTMDPCVDGPDEQDYADHIRRSVADLAHLDIEWPPSTQRRIVNNDDQFLGLVECVFDLVARPRLRSWHDFAECGWHYRDFYRATGQNIYAWRVNELFQQHEVPLYLETEGELRGRLARTVAAPQKQLIKDATRSPEPTLRNRVQHAVNLYRVRTATREDKRSACKNLADVLENRRKLLESSVLHKRDEADLFEIANKFAVRHYKTTERDDYDEAFLDWLFYWYLATVELTETLLERSSTVNT